MHTLFMVLMLTVNADEDPEFVDAPYQFWVGADVPIGTSVGQIRVSGDVVQESLIYDLLHSYIEGGEFPRSSLPLVSKSVL